MSEEPRTKLGGKMWLLLAATLSSNATDGFIFFATPLLALTLTKDPVQVAAVTAVAQAVPAVLGLVVGSLADRHDRLLQMVLAAALRVGVTIALTVLVITGGLTMPLLYVLVALFTVGELTFDVNTTASVPDVVGTGDELERAHGAVGAGQQVLQGFVIGPLAPVVFMLAAPAPFALSIATAATAGILVIALRARLRSSASTTPADPDATPTGMLEGFREVRRNPALRNLLTATLAIGLLFAFAQGSFVFYLVEFLGIGEIALSATLIGLGVGGLVGSLIAERVAVRFSRRRALVGGSAGAGVGLVAMGLAPVGWWGIAVAALAAAVAGLGTGVWNVIAVAARQRMIPAALLGRVSGFFTTTTSVLVPLVTLLSGFITRHDPRLPWLIGGALTIAIPLVMGRLLAPVDHRPSALQSGQ